jgi:hypothetical protein
VKSGRVDINVCVLGGGWSLLFLCLELLGTLVGGAGEALQSRADAEWWTHVSLSCLFTYNNSNTNNLALAGFQSRADAEW